MIVDMSDVRREREHSDEFRVLDTLVTRGEEVEDTNVDPEVGEDDVEDDVDADTEHQGAQQRETPAARLEPELEVDNGDHGGVDTETKAELTQSLLLSDVETIDKVEIPTKVDGHSMPEPSEEPEQELLHSQQLVL